MKLTEYLDYRHYLKQELETRIGRNPQYSLRAFADSLGVSPSHLSRVLNGKKKLSIGSVNKISEKLRHTLKERTHLINLIQYEQLDDGELKERLWEKLNRTVGKGKTHILELDQFKLVSEWHHFALLSLFKLSDFQSSPQWMAKRLELSVGLVERALERLERLGLIVRAKPRWELSYVEQISTPDDMSSQAIRKNHQQNIDLALKALSEQPVEEREFGNCSLAVKERDLPRAKQMIREFLKRLDDELETDEAEEIYQLNVQFFRLTARKGEGHAKKLPSSAYPLLL